VIAAALFAAVCVLAFVTTIVQDTDLWTLLAQGRSLWSGHPPTINQWTWPSWDAPQTASSWLFRALLWPLWQLGGEWGVFAWRWASTIAIFALAWACARALGARGLVALPVLVACAAIYRVRADARPESLAAVLLALALVLLEAGRARSRDTAASPRGAGAARWPAEWALVLVALVWVNAHVTWYLLFALIGFHVLDAWARSDRARAARLVLIAVASLAVSFVHPSGWRALWAPFEFALVWGRDPMFASVEELRRLSWRDDWRSGIAVLVLLWPVLIVWRGSRRRFDLVEALACATLGALTILSVRFAGVFAVAAAPFIARAMAEFVAVVAPDPPRPPVPAGPWARSAAAIAASAVIAAYVLSLGDRSPGVGIAMVNAPVRAADVMAEVGIRGRGFNEMHLGGYLSHRFWPDRERAPFVTTQPELSGAEIRATYGEAMRRPAAWYALDRSLGFDYVLLERAQDPGDHLPDVLDGDTTWVMVFGDDAAQLWVRRGGRFADVAAARGYAVIPGGRDRRPGLIAAAESDPALRQRAAAEAERMTAESPWNGHAHHMLGYFALMDSRHADARRHFEETLRQQPGIAGVRALLGFLALHEGDARGALRLYEAERARFGTSPRIEAGLAEARDSLRARPTGSP
jgi:hypothetical protein